MYIVCFSEPSALSKLNPIDRGEELQVASILNGTGTLLSKRNKAGYLKLIAENPRLASITANNTRQLITNE